MAIGGLTTAAPALPAGLSIAIQVATTVIGIFLGALFLMLSTKIFKLKDTRYVSALFVTAITGIVGFILGLPGVFVTALSLAMGVVSFIVGVLLGVFLIKTKYELDWGKAILVWLVYFVITMEVMFVIALIIGAILVGFLISTAAVGGAV